MRAFPPAALAAALLALLPAGAPAQARKGLVPASQISDISRTADVVAAAGEPTRAFWGKKIEKIRLYALRDGAFGPIPYQVDKRDPDGEFIISRATLTEDVLEETGFDPRPEVDKREERIKKFDKNLGDYRGAVAQGKMTQAELDDLRRRASFEEKNDELDYNDEILFMLHDAGSRVDRSSWPVKEGIELELTNPTDTTKAWAYAFYFAQSAPPPSTKDYVHYDPAGDVVDSGFATLDFIDNKPLILERIAPRRPDGTQLANILDRFKLRIKIKPVALFCASLNFDENNTRSFTVGYKDGPIRVIRRNIFWVTFAGFKVPFFPKAIVYYLFYENALVGPAEVYNPFNPKYVLCQGSIFQAGVDLRQSILGIEIYTKDNKGLIVNGKPSDAKLHYVREGQTWIVGYKAEEAIGIVVRLVLDKELVEKGASFEFNLLDDDNARQAPENEPGVHFFGYDVDLKKFPKGKYFVTFTQYIAPNFQRGGERQYLDILDHPLRVRATAF